MRTAVLLAAMVCFAAIPPRAAAQETGSYPVGFDSGRTEPDGRPLGWKNVYFNNPRHTTYTVERDGREVYVKAVSSASVSVLAKETPINLKDYPILKWRWKVDSVLKTADARRKYADDAAARVYVAFAYEPERANVWERLRFGAVKAVYGSYPPEAAVNYIWDNRLPVRTALDNAHTSHSKMIVLESGNAKAGQWVKEERNVYEDYLKLFGSHPPKVLSVAIMSDTDNTEESAVAYFADISFEKAGGEPTR